MRAGGMGPVGGRSPAVTADGNDDDDALKAAASIAPVDGAIDTSAVIRRQLFRYAPGMELDWLEVPGAEAHS